MTIDENSTVDFIKHLDSWDLLIGGQTRLHVRPKTARVQAGGDRGTREHNAGGECERGASTETNRVAGNDWLKCTSVVVTMAWSSSPWEAVVVKPSSQMALACE